MHPAAAAESWRRYVQRHAAANPTAIAKITGISRHVVMGWNEAVPSADDVITFAEVYNCSTWEALNAAGLILAAPQDLRALLSAFSAKELFDEAKRRVAEAEVANRHAAVDDKIARVAPVTPITAVDGAQAA
ncbi:hypothetical protein GCM10025867_49360 (plasmid) [Frondihabitans sucicola]|uniref:XRE family transcriptional regulator n=1 Tax=Frondihabitans sucicola TaxID=1268041 RepID=A0ABN6Y9U3_9MICO|nr:hypothetical protein [Frondihabitans sucicola]BDZ52695.1 hypothetical protein GCM10025867_49360 [Frondihabitans sucicola]